MLEINQNYQKVEVATDHFKLNCAVVLINVNVDILGSFVK